MPDSSARLKEIIFRISICCFLICSGFSSIAQEDEVPVRRGSQVLDDSTKQIYGPRTSRYFFESDVFFNRKQLFPIDTLIRNFHRWTYVQANSNFYQDMGNVGTPIQPIYYQMPEGIGVRLGINVYDLFWDSEPIKYYDTKSPFSNMKAILGGKGRSITRATFSRNINPRWNFGLTYRGLLIDKQLLRRKGDRNVRSDYYDFYTAYHTKDSAYTVFTNFRRQNHRIDESGGVLVDTIASPRMEEFFDTNARPRLTGVTTSDLRMNFHLFHQYSIAKGFQIYHTLDRYRQKNIFAHVKTDQSDDFFDHPEIEIDEDTVRDDSKFRTMRNEVGLKGSLGKLFYNGYFATRRFDEVYRHLGRDTLDIPAKGNETYLGGRIAFRIDSLNEVRGWIEVLDNGNYRVEGSIRSKWLEGSVRQMRYYPGFIAQAYRGTYDYWENNFVSIEATQVNGYLHYNNKVVSVSPGFTFTSLKNYVFYDRVTDIDTLQRVLPVQSTGNQIFVMPELRLAVTFFRHITFSNQIVYSNMIENADNAIRIPEIFVNSQLSYQNIFFNGNLDMHGGVDFHWRSDYFAPAYDPAIAQFYNQNSYESKSFPLVDLFFSAKIKRGRIFFKYHNFVQALTKEGYLPTPFYPGQSNVLDFGFDWSFYD